jgi:hypothetical protein
MVVELVEKPLPKPSDEGYIEARLLEALGEAKLALRFLEEGLTRNAACKAFQAWKALLAALLRLELDKLKALANTEEERRWLESKAVPRVPTTRMKELGRLLEEAGHYGISAWTAVALDLHEYQYHGPDPDMAFCLNTPRASQPPPTSCYSSKNSPDASRRSKDASSGATSWKKRWRRRCKP